ncbi:MAG TPA: SDR family oxidoreductase [Ktedonobacterales bacterium]|nr:SDR family oxidoreductase [Ktedonobacterales bacterium]
MGSPDQQQQQSFQRPTPPKPLVDLHERVAVVTGASSGIGEAITEGLVRAGAHVVMFARRTERIQQLGERLATEAKTQGEHYGETLAVTGDVREEADVQRLMREALDRFGRIDILIANAGFGYRKLLVEGDPAIWKAMIDTNVYGLLLTLKYGVRPMLERGQGGNVVVTSSVAGRVPTITGSAYCGTKFAATAIADSLREEVGPRGIQVTTIEPGVVISEFQEKALYTPDVVGNMLKGAEPLMPGDIARAVVFAVRQPANVGINEIVVRPTGQAYP